MNFNMKQRFWIATLITLVPHVAVSQVTFSISGSVTSSETNEPITGAQIFINGSTIGTLSDEDGRFVLDKISAGIHELVVRFLGFESASKEINTDNLNDEYRFILKEKIYELEELTVKPNPIARKQNMKTFREKFIGVGPFSENTLIKNEEQINFEYNIKEKTLIAFAYDRLEIENKDLGYNIFFYLDHFLVDFENGISTFYGQTLFVPKTSKRKRTRNKWETNRINAYKGSFQHFTNSLINNTIKENRFVIKGERRDSTGVYVSRNEVDIPDFFQKVDSSTYKFHYVNFLNVTYENEYEDMSYLYSIANLLDENPRLLPYFQKSSVLLGADSVLVDQSGYIYDPAAILFDGYWGFEKVSDMLPLDYAMPATKK